MKHAITYDFHYMKYIFLALHYKPKSINIKSKKDFRHAEHLCKLAYLCTKCVLKVNNFGKYAVYIRTH